MQSKTVNQRANKQYAFFEASLFQAGYALQEMKKLTEDINHRGEEIRYFSTPHKEDVQMSIDKAQEELDVLKRAAKKYKQELLSRGWRV